MARALWLILGGLLLGIGWWIAGALFALTIVGVPWSRACFAFGSFCFSPGDRVPVRKPGLRKKDTGAGSPAGDIVNVFWIMVGIWLAIAHAFAAMFCAATLIGLPFARLHLQLAECALLPRAKMLVPRG